MLRRREKRKEKKAPMARDQVYRVIIYRALAGK
jgi:hypothetical protein